MVLSALISVISVFGTQPRITHLHRDHFNQLAIDNACLAGRALSCHGSTVDLSLLFDARMGPWWGCGGALEMGDRFKCAVVTRVISQRMRVGQRRRPVVPSVARTACARGATGNTEFANLPNTECLTPRPDVCSRATGPAFLAAVVVVDSRVSLALSPTYDRHDARPRDQITPQEKQSMGFRLVT
ncbi:hypothetical protein BJ912DRAFT_1047089 [Pholiota molesta]|nr:hypothetical protein BJ912DRAFT_1047089 [Pholiota molesta]